WRTNLDREHQADVNNLQAVVSAKHDGRPRARRACDEVRVYDLYAGTVCQAKPERPERSGMDDLLEILGSHSATLSKLMFLTIAV
ncbi:MAG: hypothetical protein ACXWNX_05150, partial [Isosphaeraceae bacterium]